MVSYLYFYRVSILKKMNELQPKGLKRIKTHKKENSTDNSASFQKRRYIEVISADHMVKKLQNPSIKTIVQLKKQ